MTLNSIKRSASLKSASRTVGRGYGTGSGKTAGRGHKGQKSRSGVSIKGFEGGQMPLLRRVPKRGFHNNFSKKYCVITFYRIDSFIKKGLIKPKDEIGLEKLKEIGFMKGKNSEIKLINKGELNIPLSFVVSKVSAGAKKAVETAGGKVSLISEKKKTKE